jgi:hypothetical protein
VLDLDPFPAVAGMVGRGQGLAGHVLQAVGGAGGPDVPSAAGVPRRRPDLVLVQAEFFDLFEYQSI